MIYLTKDRALVKVRDAIEKYEGLIIIPPSAQEQGTRALVVAVGPLQNEVVPGDEVIISKYAGVECPIAGDDFVILDGYEIMAVVEES